MTAVGDAIGEMGLRRVRERSPVKGRQEVWIPAEPGCHVHRRTLG